MFLTRSRLPILQKGCGAVPVGTTPLREGSCTGQKLNADAENVEVGLMRLVDVGLT